MKGTMRDHIFIIKQNSIRLVLFLCTLLFVGCREQTDALENFVTSHTERENLYVNIRACIQTNPYDTLDICNIYSDIVCSLELDSSTQHLSHSINDYILTNNVMVLPAHHSLLDDIIYPDNEVDSIYKQGGYSQLIKKYFFGVDEVIKENDDGTIEQCHVYLDYVRSACGNSVYFGSLLYPEFRSKYVFTPYCKKEDDSIMDINKQKYIISLLYKNKIYCKIEENFNIRLLEYNLNIKDIRNIAFPIIEVR